MSFFDSEYSENENEFLESTDLPASIKKAKALVEEGKTFTNQNFLEDVVDLCIDNFRYRDALYFVEKLLEVAPYNADLYLQKGICLVQLNQNRRAMKSIDKALSLNPVDVDALAEKASININLKNFEEAQRILQQALAIEPKNELIYYRFGKLYQMKELYVKAAEYFEKAAELDPEFSEAVFQMAISYEYGNNYQSALDAYEKYLDIEPNCEVGWFNRGIVLEGLNKPEKAINSYELSLAIDDHFTDAWFNLGNLFADLGKYDQSIECFKNVLKLERDDEAAYFNIATIYEEKEDYVTAIKFYTRAIKKDSGYHEAFLGRGFCFYKLNKVRSALRDFRLALAANYFSDEVWDVSLRENFQIDESTILRINELIELNQKNPTNVIVVKELSKKYSDIFAIDKAIDYLFKALQFQPNDADSYYQLSKLYFQKKMSKHGLYYMKKAFSVKPELKKTFTESFPGVIHSKLFISLMEDNSIFQVR
ncbi:MAG: tetratricopeptide repeat protein [Ignavibacteriaceae bacterium]|nr:tetratricopeptide repeat protein [Ignavibacteriaceae bacterium]